MRDLHAAVKDALSRDGVVNVPAVALQVRRCRFGADIELSELEGQVMATALALNAVMLFQRPMAAGCPNESGATVC